MPPNRPPEPWHGFFLDVEANLKRPVVLECIGGFAISALYGLPRPTIDVDCVSVIPAEEAVRLESLAGKESELHDRHGVYLQHVRIITPPENYAERLMPIFPKAYRRLRLFGFEAHDLALSKLERNSARDREDVKFLARAGLLDLKTLANRYNSEVRPYIANSERHDLTMNLWLEMLSSR